MQNKSSKSKNVESDILDKGKRVRTARKFADLTREDMGVRHNIPLSTLRGWEIPGTYKNKGLTLKGAHRLAKALKIEGVNCSIEWLMEGTGVGPHFFAKGSTKNKKINSLWGHHLAIQNEISFFQENNPDSIVLMMNDDGLEPSFTQGSYVGGIKKYKKEMLAAINHYCIIETNTKEILIRKLCLGKKDNTFSLFCTNPNTLASEPILHDVKLNWAAPIVWIRKTDV